MGKQIKLRTVLITGASSGIGAALAIEYAAPETTLLLLGRNQGRLEKVSKACTEKGALVRVACVDVTDAMAMAAKINDFDASHTIDLVIANAGISGGTSGQGVNSGEQASQVRDIFATNVDGVLNTILPLIPRFKAQGHGQIAIMSSLASFRGLPSAPAYSASKAAVRTYGEALRGELASDNIQVTVICPGYIKTPLTDVNRFPMPMLMRASKAARIIKRRLEKKPPRIAFPFPMYFLVWLAGSLSPSLTDWIFFRLPKK